MPRKIEQAGADALELNVYFLPTHAEMDCNEVERLYLAILKEVKSYVHIPVAVKLSPSSARCPNMAHKLDEAGADGLVLFNRFYQPDFNLEELTVEPNLLLSTSRRAAPAAALDRDPVQHVKASMALTTGVHTPEDVVKAIMAGADVANVCSVLLHEGPDKIAELVKGLDDWMEQHEYESIGQMKGALSQRCVAEPGRLRACQLHEGADRVQAEPGSRQTAAGQVLAENAR